ncbi:MAG TPA: hypothetical protein VIC87_18255 [Vicinamibacteria bacterium]
MKKTIVSLAVVGIAGGWAASSWAADPPVGTQRPKVMTIFREEVKPGRQAAHEKSEAQWPATLRKANSKGLYLAMSSGDQVWFLNPYASFAAIETQAKEDEANTLLTADLDRLWAADGEMLSRTSSLTVVFNEELSYRTDWDVAKIRYYGVDTVRVQPGYGNDFAQLRKLVKAAHEKAKVDERWSVYEVVTGAPDITYLFFFPITSLAELDRDEEKHGKEYRDALGEDTRGRLREFQKNAVRASESRIFRLNPKMSYLPKELVDRDPEFWTPKPPPSAAAKKTEKQ